MAQRYRPLAHAGRSEVPEAHMRIDVSAAPPVTGPRSLTPPRRSGSARRTASLTVTWGPTLANRRRSAASVRELPREVMPDERSAGTPLYLLLDDLSGASLVSGFALALWPQRWPADWQDAGGNRAARRSMEGVCIGFQSGSSALSRPLGAPDSLNARNVGPLPDQDDSLSWHAMDYELVDVSMRRARRIDVWLDGDRVEVDAAFQDSATHPDGGRVAVHQYRLWATAELATGRIEAVHAEPHVLPFGECPLAVLNIPQLVGTPLQDMRDTVLERLKGVHGCTHVNDALRSLAEVPILARFLAKL